MRRLRVHPRHPAGAPPHGCPLCPENLCKGAELGRLRALRGGGLGAGVDGTASPAGGGDRGGGGPIIMYAGDGENDLCPATVLRGGDVLLVRVGRGLERCLRRRGAGKAGLAAPAGHPALDAAAAPGLAGGLAPGVRVYAWEAASELAALVEALVEGDE